MQHLPDTALMLAGLFVLARELMWLAAVSILLSGIDDLAVDCVWILRVLPKRRAVLPPPPATPGRFAILVPAWDESAVIGAMLRRLLGTLDHPDYHVFVGAYPNDPATIATVRGVDDPRVTLIITDRPGPTTKADCLNQLWRAAMVAEARAGRPWKAIVLHDAEDVLHPMSLSVHDRHIPALAMVQLPVLPLPDRQSRWVSGHYLDEFAETHQRDMMVRATLDAPVPSAGVGTAIARDALLALAGPGRAPFDETCLTEDYEIGHRLHALGHRGRMVRHRIDGELVATREYFPASLEAAIRQKSRWLFGIALAGTDRLGWAGPLSTRWMLLRDRKGLVTSAISMLAYLAACLALVWALLRHFGPPGLPPLLGQDDVLLKRILLLNALILGWRLLTRGLLTLREHGLAEGLRAIPRAVFANAINFLASLRAMRRYYGALGATDAPAWDKTMHRFPADEREPARG